jgi:hypothetical protein
MRLLGGTQVSDTGSGVACVRCRQPIPLGQRYWSLSKTRESVSPDGVANLAEIESLIVICDDCSFTEPRLYDFLREAALAEERES